MILRTAFLHSTLSKALGRRTELGPEICCARPLPIMRRGKGSNRSITIFGYTSVLERAMDARRVIRLLVVEDSPVYQYIVRNAFSERVGETRWELTVAKDGEEALHILLFDEERDNVPVPNLILLDWDLPKVSGE